MQHSFSNQPKGEDTSGLSLRFDWGEALDVRNFYGREHELTLLTRWIMQDRSRVVSMSGMGGIGKSALAVTLMHQLASSFQVVIFRSVRDAPPCKELLIDYLHALLPRALPPLSSSSEQLIDLLLESFKTHRCLLVLDNLEALLQEQDQAGRYCPGYEDYEVLMRRIAETEHQSCLLLTTRENPANLDLLANNQASVHILQLTGLERSASERLLAEREVVGTTQEHSQLIEMYMGNPLALCIVAEIIVELFGGGIGPFLEQGEVIFSGIRDLLAAQFARLSEIEQSLLICLAIGRESFDLEELLTVSNPPIPRQQAIEAVEALQRRSLIEQGKQHTTFTLQSVVMEFVTTELVERISIQVQQTLLELLTRYALELPGKEYIRQTQERMLVSPIITHLLAVYQHADAVEAQLQLLLNQLRDVKQEAQGYGPANLITLLRNLRGHLRNIDLSHLTIRSAYLQGVEMQDATLAGATLHDTSFTQAFDPSWGVAISGNGAYWAAGSARGEIRVWRKGVQILHQVWQAHTDNTYALSFSPGGDTLASASWDGTVKLWDLESGALLWTGWHTSNVQCLAFSPNGNILASGGHDATVRLWNPRNGTNLHSLPHPGYVFAVTWSPDGHLLASGDFNGGIRVWEMQRTSPTSYIEILSAHGNWVMGLAFAPDGKMLASASWDRTVKLWEMPGGRLIQTLTGHTERVYRVAWSPDGRTLASCSVDRTIRLWDIKQGSYRAVLHGHTATVYSLAFTPDSSRLFSGGEDGILRVWDVASGQCIHVTQGYVASLYDISWNPTGTQLASGGSDTQVIIWDVSRARPSRVLHGHHWIVAGVGWSPDGRWLASGSWDSVIRLWDPNSGACVHMLQDPEAYFQGVAWSPDGHLLACGTYMNGVHVWDIMARRRCWIGSSQSAKVRHVAWNPDGTLLASGDDAGHVCLWQGLDGTLQRQLPGHTGIITGIAWSPDGTRLASSGGRGSGELFVWDVRSGQRVQAFEGHPGIVSAVTWCSSGNMLVSGGSDGMLRWWDVHSGTCVKTQAAHQGAVHSLRPGPDGKSLASCGEDSAIMIWNQHTAELLQTLRRDRPYERLNITGIEGLTSAQKAALRTLGAIEEDVASLAQ
jgi:WD40 repeat protein